MTNWQNTYFDPDNYTRLIRGIPDAGAAPSPTRTDLYDRLIRGIPDGGASPARSFSDTYSDYDRISTSTSGWNDLDDSIKQLFYGTHGEAAPQVWEQQNAQNIANNVLASLAAYQPTPLPAGYGQDPGTAAFTFGPNGSVTGFSSGQGSNLPGGGVSGGVDLRSLVGLPFQMGPSQQAPMGTSTYGPSMYWADSVPLTDNLALRPGEVNVQRSMNEIRYYDAANRHVRTERVPANDPTYGLDGRIKNQSQLAAVSSPFHYETTRGDVQGEFAPLADYFLRSDTPTGITTEPIPQGMQDLLQRALSAGVIRQASGPRPGAAGAGAGGAGGAGGTGAGGTGAGGGGLSTEQQYWQNRAATESADQAARQVYQAWLMRTGDDRLAMDKAQQEWTRTYQQATLTGTYNGQETQTARQAREELEQRKREHDQTTANNYLTLLSTLRGPANYAQYARVLNSTPGGIRDIVNAAAGRYQMSSGNSGNQSGQGTSPATLGTLFQDASQGVQMPDYSGLAAPNQINAANYNAMNPSQRDLLGAGYEAQGYDTRDVFDQYMKSLPKYGGPRAAGVSL